MQVCSPIFDEAGDFAGRIGQLKLAVGTDGKRGWNSTELAGGTPSGHGAIRESNGSETMAVYKVNLTQSAHNLQLKGLSR
ncbi:hypothetical protein [Leptolyngbya sp. 7M]|uniref:hypothetical protein n=1 Tax=Leptolyngbya sp. 7M TaxID=2812896 RepID=UPI001B8BE379|nr:hypothetical protein [Leptolyngbya sp. 7M]QYO62280.1 hypothetical protein JVX88_19490 [Leptolyngbya sp. 7M]